MNPKTKNIIGWVITGLISALFLFSAFGKLTGNQEVVDGFAKMNLSKHLFNIGIVELLCVVLFIIPRTGIIGGMMLIGYLGGTILAHLQGGLPIYMNIFFGIMIGIAILIRNPETGKSLFGSSAE
jgi:hypothetical protein